MLDDTADTVSVVVFVLIAQIIETVGHYLRKPTGNLFLEISEQEEVRKSIHRDLILHPNNVHSKQLGPNVGDRLGSNCVASVDVCNDDSDRLRIRLSTHVHTRDALFEVAVDNGS